MAAKAAKPDATPCSTDLACAAERNAACTRDDTRDENTHTAFEGAQRAKIQAHYAQTQAGIAARAEAKRATELRLDSANASDTRAAIDPIVAARREQPARPQVPQLFDALSRAEARAQREIGVPIDSDWMIALAYLRSEVVRRPDALGVFGSIAPICEQGALEWAHAFATCWRAGNVPGAEQALDQLEAAIVALGNGPKTLDAQHLDRCQRRLDLLSRHATHGIMFSELERFEKEVETEQKTAVAEENERERAEVARYRSGAISGSDKPTWWLEMAERASAAVFGPWRRNKFEGPQPRAE